MCIRDRPSLVQVASNCEKRAIGTNAGFGYRSLTEGGHIELLDSIIPVLSLIHISQPGAYPL